ncbi:hypothetical protein BAS09_08825 [Elizabethkingia ursingii]|uniref:Uncharacterized protein n=1 Tax=Elizabethkingia ursingii TaxID=1756150 RepID=A0AAJ3TQT8_9FLAO|nr:hypothetical protein BBD34_19110 [Elizabethkingia ursingii]OPB80483.1 hypothetical protein BAY32_15805 [Elizabethkingia ursingii]OPC03765.1 hypothetical protein BAS09_08825 [Elizabethkingia ursingii]
MCKYCFENELMSFRNEELSNDIDLRISLLLSTKTINFEREVKSEKEIFNNYEIYKCRSCNQKWSYSAAELYWRGFLLKEENLIHYLTTIRNSDKRKRTTYLAIILTLIISITVLFWIIKF